MMPHEAKFASALMAFFHKAPSLSKKPLPKRQSPDDKRDQPSNEDNGCKGHENPQIDEPGKSLFYNMSNLRTSDGETGDARFEVGHLIEPDKRELSRTNDFTNDFLFLLIAA